MVIDPYEGKYNVIYCANHYGKIIYFSIKRIICSKNRNLSDHAQNAINEIIKPYYMPYCKLRLIFNNLVVGMLYLCVCYLNVYYYFSIFFCGAWGHDYNQSTIEYGKNCECFVCLCAAAKKKKKKRDAANCEI